MKHVWLLASYEPVLSDVLLFATKKELFTYLREDNEDVYIKDYFIWENKLEYAEDNDPIFCYAGKVLK